MLARRRDVRSIHPSMQEGMLESLESRRLLSGFSWTAEEVYLTELVNRARSNPLAEGSRLGIDLSAGLTTQELEHLIASEPLAMNEYLTVAARAHSLDMAQRDFFDHVNPDGLDPTDRAQAAGYGGTAGENIAAGYSSVDEVHAAWLDSLGHRKNVLSLHAGFDGDFHYDEFGPGLQFTEIGPFYDFYTQLFGVQSTPVRRFVLGVVYTDANSNAFYNIGEGLGNVRVDVAPLSEPWNVVGTYTTDAAGNYQISVAAGAYVLRFTNLTSGLQKLSYVTISDTNVKADARASEFAPEEDGTFRAVYGRPIQSSTASSGNAVSTINQLGNPVVFAQDGQGEWSGYDLVSITGSPSVVGQVASWIDSKDGLLYAAAAGPSGVILYRQNGSGVWNYRNLTTELGGVSASNGQLVMLEGADGLFRLAGLSANGKLVLYAQDGTGAAGEYNWTYSDLTTQHLEAQGQTMPQFVGEIIGYSTSWNGLNVAGLDAQGNVHAVWWAPGLELWQTDNLSAITGAPAFTGGLTAYTTSWDGINIAGVTANGSLSVTWWVPSLGGQWLTNNLTQEFDGPSLLPSSVSSYVSSWGGLNVAGIDQTGRVVVYWWSPENSNVGWQVAPLSTEIDGAPLLEGRIVGLAADDSSLNVFGFAGDGNVIRYHWAPGGSWTWQDVTAEVGGPT